MEERDGRQLLSEEWEDVSERKIDAEGSAGQFVTASPDHCTVGARFGYSTSVRLKPTVNLDEPPDLDVEWPTPDLGETEWERVLKAVNDAIGGPCSSPVSG